MVVLGSAASPPATAAAVASLEGPFDENMLLAPTYRHRPSTFPSSSSSFQAQHQQQQPRPSSLLYNNNNTIKNINSYNSHQTRIPLSPQPPSPQPRQQDFAHHWYQADTISAVPARSTQAVYDPNSLASSSPSALGNLPSSNFHNLRIGIDLPLVRGQEEHELMQPDRTNPSTSWNFSHGQLTPTSARANHHHRDSSLSSVGSAGPSSPYPNAFPHHPQVVPSDSAYEYYDGLSSDQVPYSYLKTPAQFSQDSLLPASFPQQFHNAHLFTANPNYASLMALQKRQAAGDDELVPAPEYAQSSRPSVASTHDSPATPSLGDDSEEQTRKLDFRHTSTIPKLDRTMSDAYNDELYSPNFSYTSAPPIKLEASTASPSHSDVFSQRLQAANSEHLNASSQPAPAHVRGRSPFRQGSPLAPSANSFSAASPMKFGSAQQMREQLKAQSDARILQQQIQRQSPPQVALKTISPKDALLEYHETEEDAAKPLFPRRSSPQSSLRKPPQLPVQESQGDLDDTASLQSFGSMATSRRQSSSAYSTSSQSTPQQSGFTFVPPAVPGGVQVPQQYPFIPATRRQQSSLSNATERTPEFPSTLTSMDSTNSEYLPEASDLQKPAGATADGGTYTCTYHGCTLRFESPAKLQRHKREGHRQSAPLIGGNAPASASVDASGDGGSGMTSAALLRNSQAGPHKCERINPSTGKPCNTIFSRPYDLTRHEDTIHNVRKQKVRCHLCTEEKTFSRNDALTRHMRVVHPEVDFPGKIKRRGQD